MIKLSIIIPAYNVAPWIEATLRFPPLTPSRKEGEDLLSSVEYVVVNDGSTDNTAQIVEAYVEAHPEMKIRLINQTNQGVSVARNHGLHEAKGEYVWFVDGDDMIAPHAVQAIFNIMEGHPGVDVIKTGTPKTFSEESEVADLPSPLPFGGGSGWGSPKELFNEPYSGLYIYHGRHIWRRELLMNHGIEFPVGIVINEDFCFTIQAMLKARIVVDAPWLLAYLYRKRGGSVTDIRKNPERFMPKVESGLKALQTILGSLTCSQELPPGTCPELVEWKGGVGRVRNLMIAMNITHILDPLPLSFVRSSLRKLEEMGAYPFTPEPDHSRLLRFVLQHKWAIIAVSQIRRLRYKLKM